jgi:hypothetical protein
MKNSTWWYGWVLFMGLYLLTSSWIFHLLGSSQATGMVHPWLVVSFVAPWGKGYIQQEHD